MQLSSSLFAVAVIQIKPNMERLLKLDPGSLTKEVKVRFLLDHRSAVARLFSLLSSGEVVVAVDAMTLVMKYSSSSSSTKLCSSRDMLVAASPFSVLSCHLV